MKKIYKRIAAFLLAVIMIFASWPGNMSKVEAASIYNYDTNGWYTDDNGWNHYSSSGKYWGHLGVDYVKSGSNVEVKAIAAGDIVVNDKLGANGNTITIKHNLDGVEFYSFYSHMKDGTRTSKTSVNAGDTLGIMGATGGVTGAHVHLGIYTGPLVASQWGYNKVNGVNTKFDDGGKGYWDFSGNRFFDPQRFFREGIDFIKGNSTGGNTGGGGGTTTTHTVNGTYSAYLPIHSYAVSTGTISVYDVNGNKYSNRNIDGSTDLCIIQEIYTDGWCKVKYPSSVESSGYFTAYVKLSEFIPNASPSSWTANVSSTAYRRSTGSDKIGSVSAGDKGLRVSSANGRLQIVYPVSGQGYYKMGWIIENGSGSGTQATNYKLPCYSFAISTGDIPVYDSNHNVMSRRYITGSTDECIIREIYTDGWCYVSYPSTAEADGYFEAYVPLNTFIPNANPLAWTAPAKYTAYRRSTGGETIGSVSAGDVCVAVSEQNGRLQVMYPVTGQNYYKMGWVDTSLANNPQGVLDECTPGIYSVKVRGWAFDRDDLGATLKIHVYVGGVFSGSIDANTSRTDVHNVHGCGNYHGFDGWISVDKSLTGSQKVDVYAINVGGGTNPLIGSTTVNIGSDTTKPTISNVKISEITSAGYTVSCTVTDANGIDRVQFPTWTHKNGQDDLFADWGSNTAASGTANGNTYTYKVRASAHNNEGGMYATHIYAYDKYGNVANVSAPDTNVPIEVQDISLNKYDLNFNTIGAKDTIIATITPSDATNKNITWTTDNASVATVNNGTVTAVANGTAIITATASNGAFATCRVTVNEPVLLYGDMSVTNVTAEAGKEAIVAIRLDSNPGLVAARLQVAYNSKVMQLSAVQDGGILGEYTFGNDLTANPYTVMWENGLATSDYTSTGDLVYLTFKINKDAVAGDYSITITYNEEEIYNKDLVNVNYTINQGKITVTKSNDIQGTSGALSWKLNNNGVLTFTGTGKMKEYESKKEMPWYPYLNDIKQVVLEEGVTSIGAYAFYGMPNLTSVTIPESVSSIGDYAFKNSEKLNNVILPSGLSNLGDSAFYACTSLTSIEIPASLYTIKPYAFKNCTSLATLVLHEGNLMKISDGAFYNTALTEVTFPACLDIIDAYSFKNCSKLATINIKEGDLLQIREAVFYGSAISSITIPEGVTVIKPYAFKNCDKLTEVSLPKTLTSIDEAAFYACTNLKTIDIPAEVMTIGNYTFRKCSNLIKVNFDENSKLKTIGESSFYGCESLMLLQVPAKVIEIKGYAFKSCSNLDIVILSKELTKLGESAFYGCSELAEIIIPNKVTSIGEYCFAYCKGLKEIYFEGNAPAIGTGAFKEMEAIVCYPGDNITWEEDVMQNYGGDITWKVK